MKIELGKQYRLENGWDVRIYAVDGGGHLCVHGAYYNPHHKRLVPEIWDANGCGSEFDIIEIRPRHKRTVWINIYPGNGVSLHLSRELADANAFNRHSCIEHTFDFTEGDGL